jgi:hypothetical protein
MTSPRRPLSDAMLRVLLSADDAGEVRGPMGTVVALINRGLITPATSQTGQAHLLTDNGKQVLAVLRGPTPTDQSQIGPRIPSTHQEKRNPQ